MVSMEGMRAECVRHYVERGHSPAHADLIVSKDEAELLRIYGLIQEEKEKAKCCKKVPCPIAGLNVVKIVEIQADEEAAAE